MRGRGAYRGQMARLGLRVADIRSIGLAATKVHTLEYVRS